MKTFNVLFALTLLTAQVLTGQAQFMIGASGSAELNKISATRDFSLNGEKYSRSLSYGGGFDAGVQVKKLALMTGLRYQVNRGSSHNDLYDLAGPGWYVTDASNGERYIAWGKRSISTNNQAFRIPLILRYSIIQNDQFECFLGTGLHININSGSYKENISFDLVGDAEAEPIDFQQSYGEMPDDLIKKSFTGFHLDAGVLYRLDKNTQLRFSLAYNTARSINNPNFQVVDNLGRVAKPRGEINMNALGFEIGYVHQLNFRIGTKY